MASHHREPLIFFGTDAFSVPTLIRLIADGWPIAAIVTKPDSRTGRGRELTMPAVKKLGLASGIPILQPAKLRDIAADLRRLEAAAGIVVAYGKIIPADVLAGFSKGLINVHGSLLPHYRGASPIESALRDGVPATGVTLMQLEPGIDTGPTYGVEKLQLVGTENRLDLYERLAEMGAELLAAKLPAILEGTIVPVPQDNSQASHAGLITKADGVIDWQLSATTIERQLRAYLGWPGSQTQIAGTDVVITAAHLGPATGPPGQAHKSPTAELAVFARDGSLIIDTLKPAGKREMTGSEFLAGHPLPSNY